MKIQAPRGVKDLLPPESESFRRLEDEVRGFFALSGFREVRIPIFESAALFSRSIGESTDIVEKEMYLFEGKGGEKLALRPEGTASLLRAAIEHRLAEPGRTSRLFYQGAMFRHERPQAGRLRQFHQAGAEILGPNDPDTDADLIAAVSRYARETAIPGSRLLLNSMGCEACRPEYRKRLVSYLEERKGHLCETCVRRISTNPLRVLDCKVDGCQETLDAAPAITSFLCTASKEHFERVCQALDEGDVPYVLSPRLVRGLDYYTETAFEWVSDALGAQSTWAAGGRYNGLVSSLGGPDVPGVGLAIGIERLYLLREKAGTLPLSGDPPVTIALHPLDDESRGYIRTLLTSLRAEGISCVGLFGTNRLKKAFVSAEREEARYIGLAGENERGAGTITIKDLKTGLQRTVPVTPPTTLAALLRSGIPADATP